MGTVLEEKPHKKTFNHVDFYIANNKHEFKRDRLFFLDNMGTESKEDKVQVRF